MATDEAYTEASELYEAAEGEYVRAVGEDATRERLSVAAERASAAANGWEAAVCERFFLLRDAEQQPALARDIEIQAEIAEALAGLWRDTASAHRLRAPV
jgi:hypothetical protein